MGLFASNEMFEIMVKYVLVKNKTGTEVLKVLDESTEKGKEEIQRYGDKVKELHTNWTSPNWKQSNDLLRRCMRYDPDSGKRELDWPLYRALLIETFMKSWDASMEIEGKVETVPCTKEHMDKLDATIAIALVDKFLERTTISEQELGN